MSKTLRSVGTQMVSAAAGAVLAVVLVSGGFAFAQGAPEAGVGVAEALAPANTVNSASIINGTVTGTDIANGTIGRRDFKANVIARWAKVNAGIATQLLRGRGVETAFRSSAGVYRVSFSASVANCGWTATLNDNGAGTSGPGQISVESLTQAPTDLIVRTYNAAGQPADTAETDGFTVTVDC